MSFGDKVALISLIFTIVTTVCVLVLAYIALAQTARPNIGVRLVSPDPRRCLTGASEVFAFRILNVGHWYGSPTGIDLTVYCNFPPGFHLHELRYGSTQEHSNLRVKAGKGGMQYMKAEGIKIAHGEPGEEIHVLVTTPNDPGRYRIHVTGYSTNDASFTRRFTITCTKSPTVGAA
jgi:hypothetical protein